MPCQDFATRALTIQSIEKLISAWGSLATFPQSTVPTFHVRSDWGLYEHYFKCQGFAHLHPGFWASVVKCLQSNIGFCLTCGPTGTEDFNFYPGSLIFWLWITLQLPCCLSIQPRWSQCYSHPRNGSKFKFSVTMSRYSGIYVTPIHQ